MGTITEKAMWEEFCDLLDKKVITDGLTVKAAIQIIFEERPDLEAIYIRKKGGSPV